MTIKHLYPTTRPALDLNFAQTKRLDPRVTFTRGSTATYVSSDGLIKTAASDEARFEHDPATGESLGLLVEESRTNLLTYSEDFTSWSSNIAVTLTSAAIQSPDGNLTATRFQEDTANNRHQVRQTVSSSYSSGAQYVLSVFAKSGVNDQVLLYFASADFSFGKVTFDLTNLTYNISGAGTSARIISYPNGWKKLEVTATATATGTSIPIYIGRNDTFQVGDPNEDFYVWGAQLETGSFSTSHIPTSGSTVTRSADLASMTGTNFSSWYNQSEGSLFSQYVPSGGHGSVIIWDGDNGKLNFWQVNAQSTAGGVLGFSTRSNQGTNSGTFNKGRIEDSTNYGFVIKHAAAIADNDFACYTSSSSGDTNLNTGSTIPATGGYLTPLVDRLTLTDSLTGVMRLSRLTYYDRRLADAQLQALTL